MLFSYHSNWDALRSWGAEYLTQNYLLIFRPLEKFQIQKKGRITFKQINLDDNLNIRYKPILYREVELDSLINKTFKAFSNIRNHINRLKIYDQISYVV